MSRKIDTTIDEIDATKAEIRKLLEESHSIREKMVGSSPEGINELVDRQCATTLGMFDDPLISQLDDVRSKRPEVVALTNTLADALRALALVTSQVKGGLDEAKEKAAVDAEKAATEAREKERTAADARKAAAVVTRQSEASSAAKGPSPTTEQSEQAKLEAALAKPILERTGEELCITGRAGKRTKTEAAAIEQDLANV